jgi:hypothetical protein
VGAPLSAATFDEAMARGVAAFERRDEGSGGREVAPEPIGEAIAAFEAALAADPGNLEAHVRLMVALWFQGEYATVGEEEKQKIFARGREVGEQALDRLAAEATGGRKQLDAMTPAEAARALAPIAEAKPLLYWSAVHWGFWGESFGRLAAARQGVAGKVRWRGETLALLDPAFERAGAARVLGRLHARAPRIPFITGWIDHDFALVELEIAVALAPEDTFNCLYLAEALAEYRPKERARIRALLEDLAARTPLADRVVEDRRNIETARRLLAGFE